jgi:hypothetical protein
MYNVFILSRIAIPKPFQLEFKFKKNVNFRSHRSCRLHKTSAAQWSKEMHKKFEVMHRGSAG